MNNMLTKIILDFLIQLQENNNRDWFNNHKALYIEAKEVFETLTQELIDQVELFDPSIKGLRAKDCTFRIYRDVRFSKDKSPYKTHFGAYINQGGRKGKTCGYYLHLEPNASILAGGAYAPPSDVLYEIRDAIYADTEDFKAILNTEDFKSHFGSLEGEKLKRGPKDFPKDFEDIELLKHKSFICSKKFDNASLYNEDFQKQALITMQAIKPFNDFFNRAILAME